MSSGEGRSMSPAITLVTGASGFVGRVVMQRLAAAGHRAVGLDPVSAATTQVHDDLSGRGRLRELLQRESITHIIHAGGGSGPMVMADDPAGGVAINVTGSMDLLYAAMDPSVRTSVYCSSVPPVGGFSEPAPIGEDYPMRPASAYGCSKPAVDYVLRA